MAYKIFLIRYFDGSDQMSSFQNKALEAAFSHYNWFVGYLKEGIQVKVEKMTNLIVKNDYKNISSFEHIFDWLLGEEKGGEHLHLYYVYRLLYYNLFVLKLL